MKITSWEGKKRRENFPGCFPREGKKQKEFLSLKISLGKKTENFLSLKNFPREKMREKNINLRYFPQGKSQGKKHYIYINFFLSLRLHSRGHRGK